MNKKPALSHSICDHNTLRRHFVHGTAGALALAKTTLLWAQESPRASAGLRPHAYLIGNSRYRPASQQIMTAHKNVRDIEDALSELGYNVTAAFDVGRSQVLAGLDKMLAETPATQPAFIYFCGHGINSLSRGEYRNYLVSANINLEISLGDAKDPSVRAKHYEEIAKQSPSLEEDIYPRLSTRTKALNVVVIDACRDASSVIVDDDSRVVQSRPPEGSIVGYATRPGRYAYTPREFNQNSYYAESLIKQLKGINDTGDMSLLFDRVRYEVRERVNGIAKSEGVLERMLANMGLKEGFLQDPDVASNVQTRPLLRPGYRPPNVPVVAVAQPTPATPIQTPIQTPNQQPSVASPTGVPVQPATTALVDSSTEAQDWSKLEALTDLEEIDKALAQFLLRHPTGSFRTNALIRQEDIKRIKEAVRVSRIMRSPLTMQDASTAKADYTNALKGDKFAAQRVADQVKRTPSIVSGDAAVAYQRWLQYAAELGNGIASYEVSRLFTSQQLVQEATRYLVLAQENGYRLPRDFEMRK